MKSILTKIIMLILLITIIGIPNTAYALDNIIGDGDSFLAARNNQAVINEAALQSTSNYIYNTLFVIAVVIAIAIGMIIGIQFMIGSAEDQAKVKETLVPYVIGVFVVFASFTIWKIVVNIGDDVSPTPEAIGKTNTTNTTYESTTYTKDANGNLYCDNCKDILTAREQRRGQCGQCRKYIEGI